MLADQLGNGIDECGDDSDEPWTCPGIINYNYYNIFNTGSIYYGLLFGYVAGTIILIIFSIIAAIGATIIVCGSKRSYPLYKWRKRQPPVGVIIAEPNQLYEDETGDHEWYIIL